MGRLVVLLKRKIIWMLVKDDKRALFRSSMTDAGTTKSRFCSRGETLP